MKRKYLYLVLTTSSKTALWDPAREAPRAWLKELCVYQEFRDVHLAQGHYYPKFQKRVDRALRRARLSDELKGWAVDDPVARSPESGAPGTDTSSG